MWIPNSSCLPIAFPLLLSLSCFLLSLFWEISAVIYPSPSFILLLHLLVIHAHTWVHVPSATFSGALWAAVAPITLSRGHVHINGVRVLTVGIQYGGDSSSWGCFSTMLLWLTHWAQNLLWDLQRDCLWRCGAFPFYDFGLPRIRSSSAIYSSNLDSLHSFSGTSSSSMWALGLIWNGPKSLDPLDPTKIYKYKVDIKFCK